MNVSSLSLAQLKPYLLPIIAVIVVIAVVPLLGMPWYQDLTTHMATLSQQQSLLDQLTTKAQQLNQLDSKANKTMLASQLEPVLPSSADPAGVLGTLEQVASASGVTTTSANFSDSVAAKELPAAGEATDQMKNVEVNLSVSGSYANIQFFISQTETVARVVSINSLHITGAQEENSLIATIGVTAPYQPIPTDLGSIETPLPAPSGQRSHVLEQVSKLHQAAYTPTAPSSIKGKPNPF